MTTYNLIKDGESNYTIVLSRDASPSESHAAEELQRYLLKIGGCRIPIKRDSEPVNGDMILIGKNEKLKELGANIDFSDLGDEGFVIKTIDPHIVLAGNRERGSMYAVYTFLEEKLGCGWYTPKVSLVPEKSTITIGETDEKQKPSFEYRDITYIGAWDRNWAARNKINGSHAQLDKSTGGKIGFYGGGLLYRDWKLQLPFVHTAYLLVPPEKYFDKHPEYFSLFGEQRQREDGQLCYSNPDVVKIATETVLRIFEENPDIRVVTVSQNDFPKWCECERCKAIDEKEGSRAGNIITFVNRVAEAVAEKYLDKFIFTLAYLDSRDPPRYAKPHKNVFIGLAPMHLCDSHPLAKCKINKDFVEDIKGWVRTGANVIIWYYIVNFRHYLLPHPNFDAINENITLFRDLGVKGVLCQGMSEPGGGGELWELRAWLLSKLLWNADADVDTLIDDFLQEYYGKAAEPIRNYIDILHEKVKNDWIHINLYSDPDAGYLEPTLIEQAIKYFDEAEQLAENEEILNRVKAARLSLQYARLTIPPSKSLHDVNLLVLKDGYVQPYNLEERKKLVEDFVSTIEREGIISYRETVPASNFIEQTKAITQKYPVFATKRLYGPIHEALDKVKEWIKKNRSVNGTFDLLKLLRYTKSLGLPPVETVIWLGQNGIIKRDITGPDLNQLLIQKIY